MKKRFTLAVIATVLFSQMRSDAYKPETIKLVKEDVVEKTVQEPIPFVEEIDEAFKEYNKIELNCIAKDLENVIAGIEFVTRVGLYNEPDWQKSNERENISKIDNPSFTVDLKEGINGYDVKNDLDKLAQDISIIIHDYKNKKCQNNKITRLQSVNSTFAFYI